LNNQNQLRRWNRHAIQLSKNAISGERTGMHIFPRDNANSKTLGSSNATQEKTCRNTVKEWATSKEERRGERIANERIIANERKMKSLRYAVATHEHRTASKNCNKIVLNIHNGR